MSSKNLTEITRAFYLPPFVLTRCKISGRSPYRGVWFFGPLVKRLRRRPFTAEAGVRFSQGSPFRRIQQFILHIMLDDMENRLVDLGPIDKRSKSPAFHAGVTGSNPVGITIRHIQRFYPALWVQISIYLGNKSSFLICV